MNNRYSIEFDSVGKRYRLDRVGTGTLSHYLNRWWCGVPKEGIRQYEPGNAAEVIANKVIDFIQTGRTDWTCPPNWLYTEKECILFVFLFEKQLSCALKRNTALSLVVPSTGMGFYINIDRAEWKEFITWKLCFLHTQNGRNRRNSKSFSISLYYA